MKFMKKSYFVVVLVLSVSLRMFKQTTPFKFTAYQTKNPIF